MLVIAVVGASALSSACNLDTFGLSQAMEGSATGGSTESITQSQSPTTSGTSGTSGDTQATASAGSTGTNITMVDDTSTGGSSTSDASSDATTTMNTTDPPGRCGDGEIGPGEDCDFGEGPHRTDELCCESCTRCVHVFATMNTWTPVFGGVSGAVNLCSTSASDAGLPNSSAYRPWLSDDSSSPSLEFDTMYSGRYVTLDGTIVAEGWQGLIDGMLDNAIHLDEYGEEILYSIVWTATETDGTLDEAAPCDNFQSLGGVAAGGAAYATNQDWTQTGPLGCDDSLGLYCFEQL